LQALLLEATEELDLLLFVLAGDEDKELLGQGDFEMVRRAVVREVTTFSFLFWVDLG
jgi:hypothetical protein